MAVKVVKVARDARGLMTEMIEQSVPVDSIIEYEKRELLEAAASGDQAKFNEVVRRRIEHAVSGGGDWRARAQFELDLMNQWLAAVKVPPITVNWTS